MYLKIVNNLFKSFLLLILLTNCTHTYSVVPAPQDVSPNRVHDFKLNKKINIVNIQQSKTNIQVGILGFDKYEGNLNEWTDKAIQLLKSELQKRVSIGVKSALV